MRERKNRKPVPPSSPPPVFRQAVMAASVLLPLSTQPSEDGGEKKEGVLTCRRVALTSGALERWVGGCWRRGGGADASKEERVTKRRIGGGGKKMERGQGGRGGDKRRRKSGVKGWVREGGQRQKWEREGETGSALSFSVSHSRFLSSSSITRHPDRAGNWTWTSLFLSLSFSLSLSLAHSLSPVALLLSGSLGARK